MPMHPTVMRVTKFCWRVLWRQLSLTAIRNVANIPNCLLEAKFHSIGKNEFDKRDAKKLIEHFKKQGNFRVKMLKKKYGSNGYYNYFSNTVYAPYNLYILSHELAHATSIFSCNKKLYNFISYISTVYNNNSFYIGSIVDLIRLIKNENILANKLLNICCFCSNLSYVSTLFILVEEAQASLRALYAIHKILGNSHMYKAAKILSIAYSTYICSIVRDNIVVPQFAKRYSIYTS